ncbi:473_t:CDS:2 [Entrophospora sp. SA101]|nr:473_t:CDS:2 [Entrophospora sp. SA101]
MLNECLNYSYSENKALFNDAGLAEKIAELKREIEEHKGRIDEYNEKQIKVEVLANLENLPYRDVKTQVETLLANEVVKAELKEKKFNPELNALLEQKIFSSKNSLEQDKLIMIFFDSTDTDEFNKVAQETGIGEDDLFFGEFIAPAPENNRLLITEFTDDIHQDTPETQEKRQAINKKLNHYLDQIKALARLIATKKDISQTSHQIADYYINKNYQHRELITTIEQSIKDSNLANN